MKRILYFVAGMIGVVTIMEISMHLAPAASATGFQTTSTPPIHISQQTQYGMFSVNENTGAISFCANNTVVPGGGGQAPIGTCSASSVGSVTPTVGSNNSLSIEGSGVATNGSGTAALVYNNQTGQAVLCAGSGVVSGGVANVVASCKSVANLH
jgi:hypothetical protein